MGKIDRRLKRILGLARQAPPKSTADPAPPFLARQVFERWQNEPAIDSSRSRFRPALVLAGGAVALVLAGGLAFLLWPSLGKKLQVVEAEAQEAPAESLKELAMIVEQPPVWQGGQELSAWLTVLRSATEKGKP